MTIRFDLGPARNVVFYRSQATLKMMLFSVVIPTHKRRVQLQRLLESLQQQTLPVHNFEVLIIPSPMDPAIDWVLEYRKTSPLTISLLLPYSDPFQGKSASFKRNYGAQNAKAPWLAFIDDDCVADKNWLSEAHKMILNRKVHALEGATHIPRPRRPTLTGKGLQNLSRPGGFQTCNMFYERETFHAIGGFDLNLPFYLEDTDLAWSFLDRGKTIDFSESAIVTHPVPPPEVKRLMDNALRARKMPYIYKKHKALFKQEKWRPLERIHWLYLFLYMGLIMLLFLNPSLETAALAILLILLFTSLYIFKLLWGCAFTLKEFFQLYYYLPITPPVAFVQLMRGNWDQKTFLVI